jgi:hypothetical protein
MTEGSVVTDCWGELFYITPGLGLELGFDGPQGFPLSFQTELSVAMFLGTLSSFDLSLLNQRFSPKAKLERTAIQRAIMRGRLHVFPMNTPISLVSAVQNNGRPNQSAAAQSNFGASNTKQLSTYGSASNDLECVNRTVLVVRSDIRNVLQQIVQQERIESRQIEKSYKTKSALEKTGAHIQHFRKGLHDATGAFLTWLKDINDVVSINQRMLRILMAAQAASHVETENRYELFQKLLNQAEKKELVEALGFDPSLITVEKITEVYSLAKLIHDDHATQLIIAHFVENYIKAQHSLEWSEFSGGASFEIILTALLVVVTGGIGVIASLGAQVKKLSQLKKLGALLSELAELLKKVPKAKGRTLREQKALEDRKARKKDVSKPLARTEPEDSGPENVPISAKSVNELIDSDLDLSNSLNGKTGEAFKNNALIDYHLNPDMDVLTKDEYMSLHVYTTNLYKPMNDGLRNFSPSDKEKWSKVTESADTALEKLGKNPNLKYEGYVVRGDDFTNDQIDNLFPLGGIHQDLGFKSSTHNISKPFYGNTTIAIKSKSGVKVEDISVKADEEEVLFRPGTKFKVLSKTQSNGHNQIELEEL